MLFVRRAYFILRDWYSPLTKDELIFIEVNEMGNKEKRLIFLNDDEISLFFCALNTKLNFLYLSAGG